MLGGLTFMIRGNMCCGVNGDELIVRSIPQPTTKRLPDSTPAPNGLAGRRRPGFITVQPDGLTGDRLNRWVQEAVARAESLPPK